ncbi:hypothetical protein QE250_15765, partial [Chromatiaceae bacterium AAb-1]|nr:hypothetical protein [Chromatiaceae bacterium AAb-1]
MLTLTNTYYSSNSSLSLNTNVMLGDTPVPAKPEQTGVTNQPQDSKGENQSSGTTNVGIHQGSSYGKGKTLATIGNGTIIVGGEETEPEGLNRDVDNIDKELYSIERTKGDLDVTIQNKHLEQLVDAVADSVTYVTDALGLTGLSKEERQQLLAEFSAAFDGGLDGIKGNDEAKKAEQIAQFATELDSIIENAGVKSLEDEQLKPGALTVYADEIRGVVMASQADGLDPLAAIIALEKLKSDINSISSLDISNPERKAEAAYIITQMQEDILNRIPLSDALGMAGWAASGRKIVIDAGKQVIKEGIGAAGDAYQGIKQYLKKEGDSAGQTANKNTNSVNGEMDFYNRVDNAGFDQGLATAKRETGDTVLGSYPNYVHISEEMGARRYQIPESVWNNMSESERWAANVKFLDRTIEKGDNIILSNNGYSARVGSYFAREIEYLQSKGYILSEDG